MTLVMEGRSEGAMREAGYRYVGHSPDRQEALEKVTGRARYVHDMELPGMLYAKMLHSPYAHAEILSLDVSEAKALPGVKAVLTGRELPYLLGLYMVDKPILAQHKVRYQGEPVAAVAAVDTRTAAKALSLIKVEYQPLPAVLSVEEALTGGVLVHEDINTLDYVKGVFFPQPNSNIASWHKTIKGDIQKGFAQAELTIENEWRLPQVAHVPLETHVVIVQADPYSPKVKIWSSSQSPFAVRNLLAKAFGISRGDITVVVPYIGGGFGGKAGIHLEPLGVVLSRVCQGRPVKIQATREEEFNQLPTREGLRGRVKTGVTKDGKIVAEEIYFDWDGGAYADYSVNVGRAAGYAGAGPYEIPNIELHSRTLYTNKVFGTAYRGFGHLETHWVIERQMDLAAQALEMDPYEFRMKNLLREGATTITGEKITAHSGCVDQCLEAVAKEIAWTGYQSAAEREKAFKTGKVRGKGLAVLHKAPAMPPNTSTSAIMQMDEDGTVRLLLGAIDMGQGAYTTMAQIAAEVLDMPLEKVKVIWENDTDKNPYDWQTVASKYTFMGGNAVIRCAQDLLRQMKEVAACVLRCPVDELTHGNERIRHIQHQDKAIAFKDLALGYAYQNGTGIGGPLIGRGVYMAEGLTNLDPATGQGLPALDWTYGAHGAEIEIDVETGEIHVLKIASAFDVGQVINRKLAVGQVVGGVIQGLGSALIEGYKYSPEGRLLNPSFTDNKIPTAKDIPDRVVPIFIENPQRDGPFGARGVGEHPMISVPSVLANAVYDALGVNFYELPLSPERIVSGLARQKE
ncbi:Aldehyde oxidase and xanthine dehydrogenase, a/b hammerhead domain protein [Acididesulfobacillus acetoxydans]|uniref:4-hydroxybenzoyl-CoA reductase subunit alpha n=1 Tax=Acididesulfobacillus acetoxydans TaxID=1561005 RepID=A0A8S0WN18_9FIRM|nr:xanthine dehydrogenase family protein molybdopterin-binding subunit [Acididesulfobacillus acetoxydans]CAA7600944.1 Aldehyde oxidase and xanthine dehydrogenase, a/b hammerhead domain protein [Acididesulfobacillus acetoxydans]CEJ08900.1 4-hydroxybenzoyl-CoA reductase subunit alpha [Acididesulfobacillus acetoxydans]